MANELQDMRVAFVVANVGVEQVEMTEPWRAIEQAGGRPERLAPKDGTVQGFNHLDPADTFAVDRTTAHANAGDYDALVLPGGVVNADEIRTDGPAVAFVRAIFDAGKPVAVICHGPWILTDADVARGRTLTSWPSLQTDLRNAGATWIDAQVHLDGRLVSSRKPADLPAFCPELVRVFSESRRAHVA
jgi:protease I